MSGPETGPTPTPEIESERRPRRLVRPQRGRLIGGVCSGLGLHFDVDPILFRIAFVGLAIFAGVGIGLYLAILLLVPQEGERRAPIRQLRWSWPGIAGVLALLAAAGVAIHLASHAALGSAWGIGVGLGWIALAGLTGAVIW